MTVAVGCSTATVKLRTGRRYEARLVGGDRSHLLLQHESGHETVVERSEIRDIDHPGNVAALIGGLMAAGLTLDVLAFGSTCGFSPSCGSLLTFFGGFATLGLGVLTWGLWTWLNSTSIVQQTLTTPDHSPAGGAKLLRDGSALEAHRGL